LDDWKNANIFFVVVGYVAFVYRFSVLFILMCILMIIFR